MMGLHKTNISITPDAKLKFNYAYIDAILTVHFDIAIQTINDALFSGLLSVSPLDHVAVSPIQKSSRGH